MRGEHRTRNVALWLLGANTGYRISELLSLNVRDAIDSAGNIRDEITVKAKNMKRKRAARTMTLNPGARAALELLIPHLEKRHSLKHDQPLFCKSNGKRLGRKAYWAIIKSAQSVAGLRGRIATHSMRKTFADNYHDTMQDLAAQGQKVSPLLQTSEALGHSDPKSTVSYLTKDDARHRQALNQISINYNQGE